LTRSAWIVTALAAFALLSLLRLFFPPGLRGQYFTGSELTPPAAHTSLDASLSPVRFARQWRFRPPDAFSAQWTGYLWVNRPAVYQFEIKADDGARLFIDREPVIAMIEETGQGSSVRTGRIRLERGSHAVLLQYRQAGGDYDFAWNWAPEGQPPAAVRPWQLSPRPRRYPMVLLERSLVPLWWVSLVALALAGTRPFRLSRPGQWIAGRFMPGAAAVVEPARLTRGAQLSCLALFSGLAVVQTWPLATDPAHLSRNDNADTVLNEWILSWVAHQLPRDPLHLFDANIFYPDHLTLAYSEPLIVQSLLGAPLAWLGASPVLVYNLVLLAGFALTGWAAALVVARWTGDWVAGIASGLLLGFNAHTLTRMPHMQALHAEFLPLALLALDAVLRKPRWRAALWLAIWFALQALTSIYLLVFTATALVVGTLVRPEDWTADAFKRVAPSLVASAAIASAIVLPFLLPYWRINNAGFERSLLEVGWYSGSLNDYWTMPSRVHGWIGSSAGGSTSLFPGIAGLVLAAWALADRPLADRRIRMCLAIGLVGFLLSFGPLVPGYATLYSILPPLQALRAPARFGYLCIVAVSLLAGFGLSVIRKRFTLTPIGRFASMSVLVVVFSESLVAPITYERFTAIPEIYRRLRSEPNAVAVHLPFPGPDAIVRNTAYMLGSTLHFKPILNGYSGLIPPSYLRHATELAGFPGPDTSATLRSLGVTHVFLHTDRLTSAAAAAASRLDGLREIAAEGPLVLYRLE
jgi:hypothetical protein